MFTGLEDRKIGKILSFFYIVTLEFFHHEKILSQNRHQRGFKPG